VQAAKALYKQLLRWGVGKGASWAETGGRETAVCICVWQHSSAPPGRCLLLLLLDLLQQLWFQTGVAARAQELC
jgi:hypothetical protein